MGRRLNNFIIRYTWLFPLLILVGAGMYYFNWFERLFTEDETAYHMAIFKELQLFESVGLIEPVGTDHMYFAAMESRSCRLTALGLHYWKLSRDRRF